MLHALGHPDEMIRRAQWDCFHIRRAPQAYEEALDGTKLLVLGTTDAPP